MSKFSDMKVATKLTLGFGLIVALMVLSGGMAYVGLSKVNAGLTGVISDKVPKIIWVDDIQYAQLEIARSLRNGLIEIDNPERVEFHIKQTLEARTRIKGIIDKMEPKLVLPEGKAALKRILEARSAFIDGQEFIFKLLRAKKADEARIFILNEMRERQAAYADACDSLQNFQRQLMEETGANAESDARLAVTSIVIALLVSMALASGIAWLIIRDLMAQLGGEPKYAADNVKAIAAGDLSRRIDTLPGDNSSMMMSLRTMQSGLADLINEIKQMVAAAGRGDFSTKISLDGKQGFGREIGEALNQLGETTNTGLADVMRVSQSLADGDLGKKIEKNYPGVFGQTGAAVNATVDALRLIVGEIDVMVQGANRGDFSTRLPVQGKKGFALELSNLLNQLSETTDSGLRDVMRVAQALAVGDLGQRIEKDYPGIFGETGRSINVTVDSIKRIVEDIDKIVQAANQGEFSIRLEMEGKHGFARQLSELLNQLSETTEEGLKDVMRVANTLAQGDLTHRIDKSYPGLFGETASGINATVANLTGLITQIKDAVDAINTAASEIAAGNQDLSSRTEEQASSLEETASSMEQLTSTVKGNTDSASDANNKAKTAATVAERGGEIVGGSVAIMADIATSSKKISDIIGVIDSIAFQTNILALNAAVEAARAGEQGRGFAVVATEVRNLAQRSAEAAKEIKGLIGESVARVEAGNNQAMQAGAQMTEIVSAIAGVSALISDIAEASVEQTQGIEQITQAVSQMDEVTQQNAALVEEAAAAAESLQEQAEQLARAVSAFKTDSGPKNRVLPRKGVPALPTPKRSTAARRPEPPIATANNGTSGDDWKEF